MKSLILGFLLFSSLYAQDPVCKEFSKKEVNAMNNVRVKILSVKLLSEVEKEINYFFLERNDIDIIDIRELGSTQNWSFMIIYKIKE